MSIFKRLSATLVSRIDQVVGEIENHDAVIQTSLTDMRKKVAAAKLQLSKIHQEEARIAQQIEEQTNNQQRWQRRAVECAKSDEAKALECVRRSQQCQQQITRLQHALNQYQETAHKLSEDINISEQRLAEIQQKLTLMRARQTSSSALHSTQDVENDTSQLLDDTFDRWELNISQSEMATQLYTPMDSVDPMEREFITQEQQEKLRNELADLLAKEEQSK